MTKEEAINTFKEWIERDKKMEYADRLENIEIYNMAIKALEQEPILDKIRAEIKNVLSDGMIHKQTVLGIIDKYKESEGV